MKFVANMKLLFEANSQEEAAEKARDVEYNLYVAMENCPFDAAIVLEEKSLSEISDKEALNIFESERKVLKEENDVEDKHIHDKNCRHN